MNRSLACIAACALLMLGACGEPEEPRDESGLGLSVDAALIPPAAIDGGELSSLELEPRPILSGVGFGDTTVVTKVGEAVVAIAEVSASSLTESRDEPWEEMGIPGPDVDGRPTRLLERWGLLHANALLVPLGPNVIEVASRALDPAALAAVAAEIRTPVDAVGAVPGELVGVLRRDPDRPVAVASYPDSRGDYRYPMAVFVASPSEQAAYLAVAHLEPNHSIDMQTEASCCANDIMRSARAVVVRGFESTISTLTTSSKVLVVPGDPGIVVVTRGVRSWDDTIPTDEQMIAIAEQSRAGTQQELLDHVRARDDAILQRQLEEIRAAEETNGWTVLDDLIHDDHPIVISTGSNPRPEDQGLEQPRGPQLCAVYLSEFTSTGFPIAACVPTAAPTDAMVIASAIDGGMPVQAGSVRDDVARVALEYPDGSIDAEIVHVPAADGVSVERIFILVATTDQQIELSGEDLTAGMRQAAFVAYDSSGAELARVPRFPHLQG